ncbi:MAG: hypothetical protein LIO75_05370 [Lachnospiraceae bacterium]|nr:hypothetical protein [Lachnospiraceae bacterium]
MRSGKQYMRRQPGHERVCGGGRGDSTMTTHEGDNSVTGGEKWQII